MPPVRTCSECGAPLSGRSVRTKTCGDKCRKDRSKRIHRARAREREIEDQGTVAAEIANVVRREAPSAVTTILQEQLAPIVRESLTEDVLKAVAGLVNLTGTAVNALEEDLGSDDLVLRQRAYTLALKYTIGHPALLQPKDADGSGQLVVQFNLPRPDDIPVFDNAGVIEAEPTQYCDMCNTEKPQSEFIAGSRRCETCHEDWKAKVIQEFS